MGWKLSWHLPRAWKVFFMLPKKKRKEKLNTKLATTTLIFNENLPTRYVGAIVTQSCRSNQPLFNWI